MNVRLECTREEAEKLPMQYAGKLVFVDGNEVGRVLRAEIMANLANECIVRATVQMGGKEHVYDIARYKLVRMHQPPGRISLNAKCSKCAGEMFVGNACKTSNPCQHRCTCRRCGWRRSTATAA